MSLASASKLLWILLALPVLLLGGSTPENTITEFVAAINAQDPAKAATMVVNGKPKEDYTSIRNLMQGMRLTLSSVKSTVNGSKAQVKVDVTLDMPGRKASTQAETLNLVKVGDSWLIVSSELGQGVLGSMASMTTDPAAVFVRAKDAAKKTACLSNLKQLATAMMMYLADNDDKFKLSPAKLKTVLYPYCKNNDLWACPAGTKTVQAYNVNTNLIGKSLDKFQDPANTVMLYEGSNGKLNFRHDGKAAVAFADCHVKFFSPADAKKLKWNP